MPLTSKLNTIINAPFTPIIVNGLQSGVIAIRITLQNISNLATQSKAKLEQILLDGGVQLIGPSKEVLMNGTARLFLMPFKAGYSIRLTLPNIASSASIQVFEVTGFSLTNQVIVNSGSGGNNDMTFDPTLYYTKSEVDAFLASINSDLDAIAANPASAGLAILSRPEYAISSHPNGHPQYGGTATSSFQFDGAGNWNTPDGGTNAWLGQAFPDPVTIREVRFRTGYGEGLRDELRVIRQYRVESSDDLNGVWTNYGTRYTQATPFSQYLAVIESPQLHKYWRVFIVLGTTSYTAGFQDVQFLG